MNELVQRENYEWMVKPTPQHEWIDKKGVYLWLAFFFSEIGAGIYFVSLFSNYIPGLIFGWLVTLCLGGIVHMLYLGNPQRAWRIFLKPMTSELSRGVWGIMLFAILGFMQIVTTFPSFGGSGLSLPFKIIMGILCLIIIMHGFMTMSVMKAIPSWNSTMLLPLSIASGIWVGSQVIQTMLLLFGGPEVDRAGVEIWSIALLLTYIGFIFLYILGAFHSTETAKISVRELIRGTGTKTFTGIILIGMALPLLVTLIMAGTDTVLSGLVLIRCLAALAGDLMLRYGLMKNAHYTPLI